MTWDGHIDHFGFVERGQLHASNGLMRRFPRPVAIGAVLKIGFKKGFENEFERALHHPIPDRRNPQHAGLAPAFRNRLGPIG